VKCLSSKLESILELFADGRYHGVEELIEESALSEEQAREILAFLIEYGFAEMNEKKEKARISRDAKGLFSS
jgi:DNA-binding IclR family transcriptional regulator